MDIKLKKFNDRFAVRVCAFVLCVLLVIISIGAIFIGSNKISTYQNQIYTYNLTDIISNDSYFETRGFSVWVSDVFGSMVTVLEYGDRNSIKEGKFTENADSDNEGSPISFGLRLEDMYYSNFSDGLPEKNSATYERDSKYFEIFSEGEIPGNQYGELKPFSEMKEQFVKDFPNIVAEIRNDIITDQLERFDSAIQHLDGLEGVGYMIKKGETVIKNDEFPEVPGNAGLVVRAENRNIKIYPEDIDFDVNGVDAFYRVESSKYEDVIYYVSLSQELVKETNEEFASAKEAFGKYSLIAVCSLLAALGLLIYLSIITGRRNKDGKVSLYRYDNIFTEFQLFGMAASVGLSILPFLMIEATLGDFALYTYPADTSNISVLLLAVVFEIIIFSGVLWFFLALVRMLKARIFLSRSLIVIAVKAIYRWIKAAFHKANPMGKFVIIVVVGCLMSMTIVLAPVAIGLLLGFGYRWIKKYNAVKKGVDEVTSGNLEYRIPVDNFSGAEFDSLARQINTISQASNLAIQNELKNQRLKTDLISNVSHDLKTPLTSIITYTDLLKKEGLKSKNAPEYLDIIDKKSKRLNTLTEDLFDAAKASSGSIPVRLEKVDILSLIKQELVELEERLKEKGLEIIISASEDKYYVFADSQLLFRVVENLFSNVEKYALENSRVYIDLSEKKINENSSPKVFYKMKNMSKAPLNIPEDELMERFKRGDESRTTEGSGLGLAIAKDLTRLQNGWFGLTIDGDLFKSTVALDAYNEIGSQDSPDVAAGGTAGMSAPITTDRSAGEPRGSFDAVDSGWAAYTMNQKTGSSTDKSWNKDDESDNDMPGIKY